MYVGSVRAMIVAGQDGAYGNAEKTVPVRTLDDSFNIATSFEHQ